MRGAITAAVRRAADRWRGIEDLLLTTRLSIYGVAVGRILAGIAYVGILVTNFPHRQLLFGAGADWATTYRESYPQADWVGLFADTSATVFTLGYLVVIAIGVAFVLGWHVRITGPLLLIGAFQILEMNPMVSDQGDNILRIGLLFMLFTDNAAKWSLDARRERLAPGSAYWWIPATVRARFDLGRLSSYKTIVHNCAVILLAAQLIVIYVAAGMYKVGGDGWAYGTAIYYPLHLDEYRVFPALNDLATATWLQVWLVTYVAVYLQLFFPALLLNRVTRRIALAGVILLHLGIAVLMGLPWFSLAMVAFDGIFVSRRTYEALERLFARARRRLLDRLHGWTGRRLAAPDPSDPDGDPAGVTASHDDGDSVRVGAGHHAG